MTRVGEWIQTYSGKAFWPLDPRVEEIEIVDIASALSKLCRFGGHCLRFYSVAEHSVLMARSPALIGPYRLDALLHDGDEAYIVDMPRPTKNGMPEYRAIQDRNAEKIAARFDLDWPMHPIVKAADNAILIDEMQQNMATPPAPWTDYGAKAPLGVTLQFWSPDRAFAEFMRAYTEFGGK